MNSTRKKRSTFAQRVDWLLAHQAAWADWYRKDDNLFRGANGERTRYLFKEMQDAGLYAPTSYWIDCTPKVELESALRELNLKRISNPWKN